MTVQDLKCTYDKCNRFSIKNNRSAISEADNTETGINKITSWVEHHKGEATFTKGVKSRCELVVTLPLHRHAKAL
jgi:hypothetical protein